MKYLLTVLSVILLFSACNTSAQKEPVRNILGEWDSHETFDGKPWHFLARFKPDGTFDGLGNGKLIVSGNYRTNGDTIFFKDALCNLAYEASYRLTYFKDSIRLNLITDTCQPRIAGSDKVALGKVQSTK
jgi:hypothetical protein